MQGNPVVGAEGIFLQHFLHAVFTADIHAGFHCGTDTGGVIHFCGGDQLDFLRLPAGFQSGATDFFLYMGYIPGNIIKGHFISSW